MSVDRGTPLGLSRRMRGSGSPLQSVATSNFRECLAVSRSHVVLKEALAGKWVHMVHYTDNTTALSMLASLSSPAAAIAAVAREIRDRTRRLGSSVTGVHVPGALNFLADRPSQRGETLFPLRVPDPSWLLWVASELKVASVLSVVGVVSSPTTRFALADPPPTASWKALCGRAKGAVLWWPPPQAYESFLHAALDAARVSPRITCAMLFCSRGSSLTVTVRVGCLGRHASRARTSDVKRGLMDPVVSFVSLLPSQRRVAVSSVSVVVHVR